MNRIRFATTLCVLAFATNAFGANHREAPITALDHKADIADFFAFVSYDDPSKVTFIMTVDPLLEPSNGPNYFPFDDEITYEIKVDNDHDAIEDLTFRFRFDTEIRAPGVFTGFVGAGNGIQSPANSPAPVPPGTTIVPPAITELDGPGSAGFSLRQSYSVSLIRGAAPGGRDLANGGTLFAVPTNVGPRTMPDYPALADQGVYDLGGGVRVFAGTVEDPFWIDLGAAFDTFNLRTDAFGTGVAGVLDDAQDADDETNFAPDDVSGFNVNAIAIEVPIAMVTKNGQWNPATAPAATIGSWGTTSRGRTVERKVSHIGGGARLRVRRVGSATYQVQRMANPLFNELIIGTGSKDAFSMSEPRHDGQFADFALDPVLARVLNAAYEATVGPDILPVPDAPRLDLLPLVNYMPPIAAAGTPPGPVADLLRLNTGVSPTPAAERSRLGLLAGDGAGYPNGRRVSDDVTDIATRVVLGVLAGPPFDGFPHNRVGDGVNANDAPYRETFPYVGYAHSGVESRHVDTGEPGCAGICP